MLLSLEFYLGSIRRSELDELYTDCVHLQPHQGRPNYFLLLAVNRVPVDLHCFKHLVSDFLVILGVRLYFPIQCVSHYNSHFPDNLQRPSFFISIIMWYYICWLYLELFTFFTHLTIVLFFCFLNHS